MTMTTLQTLIDRSMSATQSNINLDRMVCELSRYLTESEIDQCVSLLNLLSTSKMDINYTVEDAATQLKLTLGTDRYLEVKYQWAQDNQHLIPLGITKYRRVSDNTWWDGLDPEDNPKDYQKITL